MVLTIDPAVQKVAYDQLTRKRYAGAVVALQPATGAVLAMASTPSFDPNPLANHNTDTQKQAWTDYTTAKPPVLIEPRGSRPPTRRAPRSSSWTWPPRCRAASSPRTARSRRRRGSRCRAPAPRWRTTTATRAAPAPRSACARRCSAPATPRSPTSTRSWACRPSARSPTRSRSAGGPGDPAAGRPVDDRVDPGRRGAPAVGHRAARRRAHPPAERHDRRRDRQRRAGHGAVPDEGDPGPGPAADRDHPARPAGPRRSPRTSRSGSTP